MSEAAPYFDPTLDHDTSDLTEAQERTWRAMFALQSVNGGRAVTQEELSKALGLRSKQGCSSHLPTLANLGYIICAKAKKNRSAWRSWVAVVPDPNRPITPYYKASSKVARPLKNDPARESDIQTFLADDGNDDGPTLAQGYTERQIQVWRTVISRQDAADGKPPTQQEVSEILGMRSIQGARSHYTRLEAGGYMKHENRSWIAIRVPKGELCESSILKTPTITQPTRAKPFFTNPQNETPH
jgi:SOS-response transcriptional repressor LexA